MKSWLVVLTLLLGYAVSVFASPEATEGRLDKFLASSAVVAMIEFAPGSARLDSKAKTLLQKAIPSLAKSDRKQIVLRIEGLAREAAGRKTYDLSVRRTQAIKKYFQDQQKFSPGPFLVGFDSAQAGQKKESDNRIAIVVYDNIWGLDQVGLETITKLQK